MYNIVGNIDFGARIYNPRIGRWLSVDPLQKMYPFESPYVYVSNNPLIYIDLGGKSKWYIVNVYNEITNERQSIIVKLDDVTLKRQNVTHPGVIDAQDTYYNVGWYDVNLVQNITIKKDGSKVVEPVSEQLGQLRFENDPILDWFGINDTQEDVNEEIQDQKLGPGGVMWTSSEGGGQETRKASSYSEVKPENIDLLLSTVTALSPHPKGFEIPNELLRDKPALEALYILSQAMDKQAGVIDLSYTALKNFVSNAAKNNQIKRTAVQCTSCKSFKYNNVVVDDTSNLKINKVEEKQPAEFHSETKPATK